jgi:predicted flap endonuclease-1-like 5' DNA nuclease
MLSHPLHGRAAQGVTPSVASGVALGAGGLGSNVEIARLNEELVSLRSRLSAQRQEARTNQKNAERLRNEIAELKAKAASTESAKILVQERTRHDEVLVALKNKHTAELATLRESLKQTTSEASPPDQDEVTLLKQQVAQLKVDNQDLQNRITGLKQPTAGDDLTRIRGVGPAFAKLLQQHGVTTFSQVAAWTTEDITKLAPLIKSTIPRMKKWVKSAETLNG